MAAAAVFWLYITHMWLKYAENTKENYQIGALLEVFQWPVDVGLQLVLLWNITYQAVLAPLVGGDGLRKTLV